MVMRDCIISERVRMPAVSLLASSSILPNIDMWVPMSASLAKALFDVQTLFAPTLHKNKCTDISHINMFQ